MVFNLILNFQAPCSVSVDTDIRLREVQTLPVDGLLSRELSA